MRSDELRRRIGPPSALSHIIVIEQRDLADSLEAFFPVLHPKMSGWRPGPRREKEARFHQWKLGVLPDSANRLLASSLFAGLFRQARMPAIRGQSRTGEWLEAYLPIVIAPLLQLLIGQEMAFAPLSV